MVGLFLTKSRAFGGGGCGVLNENLLFNSTSYLEQTGAAASREGISPVKRH